MATTNTALISGVSTGIGLDIARFLMEKGWFVWGSVRKPEDAKTLQDQFPDQFQALVFDVTDRVAMAKAVDEISASGRPLQALINNAGMVVPGPLEHISPDRLRKQFDVNVIGLLELTQLALPLLHQARANGVSPVRIINISSISGLITSPFVSLYAASKFAVESLTDGLRRELKSFDIDVIAIQPGPIITPIWNKALGGEDFSNTKYAKAVEKVEAAVEKSKARALPVEAVSRKTYKALTLAKPRSRYLVVRNNFSIWLISNLPPRLLDRFFK